MTVMDKLKFADIEENFCKYLESHILFSEGILLNLNKYESSSLQNKLIIKKLKYFCQSFIYYKYENMKIR